MLALRVLSIGLALAATIADLATVIVVLLGARDRRIALSFALMAGALAAWHAQLLLQSIPGYTTAHEGLIDYLRLGQFMVPATVFQNAVVWSGKENERTRVLVWMAYAVVVALYVAHLRGLVFDGFLEHPWVSVSRPGLIYNFWISFAVACVVGGCVLSVSAIGQAASPAVHLRVKYWLCGALVAVPFGLANILATYGWRIVLPSGFGNILLVCVMTYAAVRHRLMDIDVLMMRAAASLMASVAVVVPAAGAMIWIWQLPLGLSGSLVVGSLSLAAFVSLLAFSRFRSYLEQEVESSFFPARSAARAAVRRLSAELVQLPNALDFAGRFATTLMDGLGLGGIAFYIYDGKEQQFALVCSDGDITSPPLIMADRLTTDDDLADLQPVIFSPPSGVSAEPALDWEAYVPLRTRDRLLGCVALAPKRSAAAIDESDVTLLDLVAAQLAIALQNAEYVRQIQQQKAEIQDLHKRLQAENVVLRAEVRSVSQFKEIIGSSAALQRVLALVQTVAPTDASVLITGETGTGKELIARAIHDLSPRRDGPLISVNCPAIPAGVAESELFGHERGAFTDAVEARPGKFELADGGTIFLDEVADLSLGLQVKLLRVLQEHETQRLGSRKVHKLSLRVVAATNRDLQAEMRAQRFREDLYYRLAGMCVEVPPLRERIDDVPMLASFFLERAAVMYQKPVRGFTAEALAALSRYSWPGNIRELQNVVERAVLLCAGEVIRPAHLADLATVSGEARSSLGEALRREKLRRVTEALAQTGGNQAAAARLLGVSPSNLARLLKSLRTKSSPSVQ